MGSSFRISHMYECMYSTQNSWYYWCQLPIVSMLCCSSSTFHYRTISSSTVFMRYSLMQVNMCTKKLTSINLSSTTISQQSIAFELQHQALSSYKVQYRMAYIMGYNNFSNNRLKPLLRLSQHMQSYSHMVYSAHKDVVLSAHKESMFLASLSETCYNVYNKCFSVTPNIIVSFQSFLDHC